MKLRIQNWSQTFLLVFGITAGIAPVAYASRHHAAVRFWDGALVTAEVYANAWAYASDSTTTELDNPAPCRGSYGPADPVTVPIALACTFADTQGEVGPTAVQSYALARADASVGSIKIPFDPCVWILANWGGEAAATVQEVGAFAKAHAYSKVEVTAPAWATTICGFVDWEHSFEPVVDITITDRRVIRDPLVAVVVDSVTDEEIDRELLLTINTDATGGNVSWENDLFSSEATDLRFEIDVPGVWTVEQGQVLIVAENDVITASSASGIFADLTLPSVGSTGTFSVNLGNALSLGLAIVAGPADMVRFEMDGGEEMSEGDGDDPNLLPWSDGFEFYRTGSGLHAQSGWKGWDNDPAFDAVVTDAQPFSGLHSAEISANADIVHEFSGADSGKWLFTAWQYIPSNFSSGGSGQLAGSYVNLLNTYNDGGPYGWSVQMQFDSNDGMLKVFHGDGLNTIDAPYITGRWVEIQVIIDLDNDWTQIYYDGSLVPGAEYSWTGGVLGGGGGALDIAAVDLYANGSTSVYYDDFLLEALAPAACNTTAVRSCKDHGPAGWLCPDMGVSGGVEPRLGGITELDIDLDDASGFGGGVTVNCSAAWGGSATVTGVVGNTVTVEFAPALPDLAYCTIELDCAAQVCVRSLEGDTDRSGTVATTDASIIKPRFGQSAAAAGPQYDYDTNGTVATTDFSLIKPKFGQTVPTCP